MIATMPSMARRSRHDNKITTPAVDCLTIERLDSPASGAPQVTPYARALMGETTTCAIIGGGPAGMVLGLLLARAGVQVTLLEKHGDFLRDFRGDTVHPTTMRLLDELGLWERFAALPYSEVRTATLHSNGRAVTYIDFERLHQPYPYVAMVPQWDLLNLLAEAAQAEPSFTLRMKTEVTGLLREGGKVTGVRYQGAEGPGELRAELTVACDGRWSIARHEAGLKAREFPVNFDVWWFKLPREGDAEFSFLPRFSPGKGLGVIHAKVISDRLPRAQGNRRSVARARYRGIPSGRQRTAARSDGIGGGASVHGRGQAPQRQGESVASLAH